MMRFGYQRKFSKQIFIDADDSKFFKLLEARELLPPPTHTPPPPPDDRKDQYFCWVSINVGSSSQCTAANPTPGVIFTSVGRLLFPSRSETGY